MSDPISVGSVSVDVVPDARGFDEKLKAQLRDLSVGIKAKVDNAALDASLTEATHDRDVAVHANVDDKEAAARLDTLTRTRTVKIKADTSLLDKLPGGFGLLGSAVIGLGPALIPVAAAATGLAGILAAPLVAAGGGLTLGGLIAGKAVASTEKQKKQIDQLAAKLKAAKQNLTNVEASAGTSAANSAAAAQRAHAATLAGLPSSFSTPSAVASARNRAARADAALANRLASGQASSAAQVAAAQRKVAEATAAYDKALKGLTPSQVAFLGAQKKLGTSFHNLVVSSGPAIFKPLVSGMNLLSRILPKVSPILDSVSGALGQIFAGIDKSVKGGGLDKVVTFFAKVSGPSVLSLAGILGNIAQGFVGIGTAFAPLSGSLLTSLDRMTASFANIGSSKGLHDFVNYVHREGPLVASTIGSIARAVGKILTALAPLGHVALGIIGKFADGIGKIPTPILTTAAAAFVSIALSLKGIALLKGGLKAISGLFGGGGLGGGLAGKLASKAAPIPVFVTNEGFSGAGAAGAAGGGATVAGESVAAGISSTVLKALASGGAALAGATLADSGNEVRPKLSPIPITPSLQSLFKALGTNSVGYQGDTYADTLLGRLIGKNPQQGIAILQSAAELAGKTIPAYLRTLQGAFPQTTAAIDAFNTALAQTASLNSLLLNPAKPNPKKVPKKSRLNAALDLFAPSLNGVGSPSGAIGGPRAIGGAVRIGSTYRVNENGEEWFTPAVNGYITPNARNRPAASGHSGPQFLVEKVVAQDVNAFLQDMQRRAHHTALDGIAR